MPANFMFEHFEAGVNYFRDYTNGTHKGYTRFEYQYHTVNWKGELATGTHHVYIYGPTSRALLDLYRLLAHWSNKHWQYTHRGT